MGRHLTDDELVLHYYGEMADEAEMGASAHMESCRDCRDSLVRLQRILALVDTSALPEPDAGLEARVWRRVQPALASGAHRSRGSWLALPRPSFASPAWAAAAVVLALAAFVTGRLWPEPVADDTVAEAQVPAGDRVFEVELDDHLNRAEIALMAFIAGTPTDTTGASVGTEDLIAANRLYRGTAISAGNQSVADVLDELERALIEIAATSAEASEGDLNAVRDWIDSRGLVFKVRVMREVLQARRPAVDPDPETL